MIDTVKPLRPPLAVRDQKLREAHLNRPLPPAGNGSPAAPPVATPRPGAQSQPPKSSLPRPGAATPPVSASWPGRDAVAKPKPLTCLECRAKAPWPAAGWYSLDRRIIPGSVPPDILSETERRTWAHSFRQWMGVYCSLTCLRRSMERLEGLDRTFREKGVGTRLAGVGTATRTPGGQQQHGGRQ